MTVAATADVRPLLDADQDRIVGSLKAVLRILGR
jgi:hypothetical protein